MRSLNSLKSLFNFVVFLHTDITHRGEKSLYTHPQIPFQGRNRISLLALPVKIYTGLWKETNKALFHLSDI